MVKHFYEKRVTTQEHFDMYGKSAGKTVTTDEIERIERDDFSDEITEEECLCEDCENEGCANGNPDDCLCPVCVAEEECEEKCPTGVMEELTADPCSGCEEKHICQGPEVACPPEPVAEAPVPEQSKHPVVIITGHPHAGIDALSRKFVGSHV